MTTHFLYPSTQGDKLVVEGDVHRKLFIITKGEVALTQENEIGRSVRLRVGPRRVELS